MLCWIVLDVGNLHKATQSDSLNYEFVYIYHICMVLKNALHYQQGIIILMGFCLQSRFCLGENLEKEQMSKNHMNCNFNADRTSTFSRKT